MKLKIEVHFQAALREDREREIWESWCPALDVFSQGADQEEAKEALRSAVLLYVTNCYKKKMLDDVLNERGFLPHIGAIENSADFISITEAEGFDRTFDFDVPLNLASPPKLSAA